MQELPVLSPVARKILKCCVYNLDDMRRFGSEIYPHRFIHTLIKNPTPISKYLRLK